MNSKVALAVCVFAVIVVTVMADDYFWLGERFCDSRCEVSSRMNPFAASCNDCCNGRGFSKGKCKGFGWQYCMCKQTMRSRIFNSIMSG